MKRKLPPDLSPILSRRQFHLASLALAPCALAPANRQLHAAQTDAANHGFHSIFNGRTIEGWHTNRQKIGHGSGGRWRVNQGVLTGEQDPPGSGNGGLLLSDKKYADFELSIEMNPDWGPCSGVFFRCTEQGAGFQMYVDYHDNGNVGHLRGEMPGAFALMPFKIDGLLDDQKRLTGLTTKPDPRVLKWPAGVYEHACTPQAWLKAWRVNDWNTARIRCVGKYPQISTWINGLNVCRFNGETCTLPGYDKQRVFGMLGRSGSIGLQVHGGKGWPKGGKCRWRHIKIKEL